MEREVVGDRHLAGHSADRQGVAAVRVDRDVEDIVAQPEGVHRVRAQQQVAGQPQDPVVLIGDPELPTRAQHPVGEVVVGAPCLDPEPAGQRRGRSGIGDQVTDLEVHRAADDVT
jgi:hypothetical protein